MDKQSNWLAIVAERHKEWVSIVKSFGEYDYAEDLVKEAYLTIYKYAAETKIIRNGIVSWGYMYFPPRSFHYTSYNNQRKIHKVYIDADGHTFEI